MNEHVKAQIVTAQSKKDFAVYCGEKMKKCSYCGEEQPERFFTKDKRQKDGLCKVCKNCISLQSKGYTAEEIRDMFVDSQTGWRKLGGWKISILNHAKGEERRFNLVECGGKEVLATNDKNLFERRLKQIFDNM